MLSYLTLSEVDLMLSGPSHSTVNHFVGTGYLSRSKVMLNEDTFSQRYSKAWK